MPSENVVRDRRKKSRLAEVARIEGTGFRRGMAPDFNYTPYGEYSDQEPAVNPEGYKSKPGSEYDKNRRMERRLFELLRQQPGRQERFLPTGFDFINRLGTVNRMDRTVDKLKENHPDVYNHYLTIRQYSKKKMEQDAKDYRTTMQSIGKFKKYLLSLVGR